MKIAITGMIIGLAACGGAAANHPSGATSQVRAVDWQNHTYTLPELGAITVKHGAADFALTDDNKVAPAGVPGASNGSYHVEPPLFADINGDGTEDAVISALTSTGGTGQFSEIDVYTVTAGQVVDLGTITGGDRGDGGIRKVALDGTAIVLDRNVMAEGDGICCASKSQHERWTWTDGKLTEDVTARQLSAQPQPPPR